MGKRELQTKRLMTSIKVISNEGINKGLPFNNKTLGGIEVKDLNIYEDLRTGNLKVRIFEKG